MDIFNALARDFDHLADEEEASAAYRRRVGRRSSGILPLLLLLSAVPGTAKGQVSWNGDTLEIDCGTATANERRCMDMMAQPQMALGKPFTCDARARTAGRCPDTITGEVLFPRRKAQDCTDQDIPGARGRCLYGRGGDADDVASLPTCDAGEWGHVAYAELEDGDYWCDGSAPWELAAGRSPGTWLSPMVQCGAGPEHDIWPDGGALFEVAAESALPPCAAATHNLRAYVAGARYRCQNGSGWAADATTYRETVTDANINTVCRTWMNTGEYWHVPSPKSCDGDTWLCLVADDILKRYVLGVVLGSAGTGRSTINAQRWPPADDE
ncbi:MAG: hypothetical protein GY719_25965 [bacterium]|nr:hypothetical protein [bacterium]